MNLKLPRTSPRGATDLKNLDSYSSRMVMNESFEIFEKSHLGTPGGALEVGAMIFPL